MLFYSGDPPRTGFGLNLANAPGGLAPPDYHGMLADEYRGYLRALYRAKPGIFINEARFARDQDVTLTSMDRLDLVEVLYEALVKVAAPKGWQIDGGWIPSKTKDLSGQYAQR